MNEEQRKKLEKLTILANRYKETTHKEEQKKIHDLINKEVLHLIEENFPPDEIAFYLGNNGRIKK